ncbi:unnamed protein product [Acanthoscelides obtectus]|uniref:Uncharacterized protein n=1 Tax=Acanthoscelides obtectus TaxID=200917 RepID=A0A9P0PF70_ACAOB|nr:unnamed protein product [Acanthoscelides obtectus]CAK1675768.1 hypothetical protein AOBTE_LOCUS30421 [Acanthoscelides obtectus]
MYSNYPSTKIKEEVDINRAGDPAIIKLEQYSNYEESSESFKIEKVKIDNWVGCGSSTMECVNGEIAKEVSLTIPIKDELAVKLENNLDDASFDTLDR